MNICKTCRKPKANYDCGLCTEHVCKSCAHFLGEDHFSFLKKVPKELSFSIYCSPCYEEHVSTVKEAYDETMEKAREVYIFNKSQSKLTSRLSRQAEPLSVEDCEDEEEAILRMSFRAVESGYNALIDIVVNTKKIIVGSHKKTIYSATAIPVKFDPSSIREDY